MQLSADLDSFWLMLIPGRIHTSSDYNRPEFHSTQPPTIMKKTLLFNNRRLNDSTHLKNENTYVVSSSVNYAPNRLLLLLCCGLLSLSMMSCGLFPDIDIEIEEPDDEAQIIRVMAQGQPLADATVLFFASQEASPDTLLTSAAGEIRINLNEWEYPEAIFVLEPGFSIGYLSGETVKSDTLNFNLMPVPPRGVRVVVSNVYAAAAVDVSLSVDGYRLGHFYSGKETIILIPYGVPQNVTSILHFDSPPGIGDVTINPASSSSIVMNDVAGHMLHRLVPYLSNELLPDGFELARGSGGSARVHPDGFVWLADSSDPEVRLTFNNEPAGVFRWNQDNAWLSAFVPVWAVLHPEIQYTPLFEVEQGTTWVFDGEIRNTFQGTSNTIAYTLEWTFNQVTTTPNGIRYTITEVVAGEQTGSHMAPRPVEATTQVIIDEDARGIWTYTESSTYSPTLQAHGWLLQNPTHNINWEQVEVVRADGSTYKTTHGKPGRMVPAGVVSYTFGNDLFVADATGIRNTMQQSPPSNQSSRKQLTRKDPVSVPN
jgi:hypothetical protein